MHLQSGPSACWVRFGLTSLRRMENTPYSEGFARLASERI
jgi:hypothetical protein